MNTISVYITREVVITVFSRRVMTVFFSASLLFLLISPIQTANADWEKDMGLSGVIFSIEGNGVSSNLDYSPDGYLLAISTDDEVLIVNTTTRDVVQEIIPADEPYSVKFTSDNTQLLIGLKSQFLSNPSTLIYNVTDWELVGQTEQGRHVGVLSANPNNNYFIQTSDSYGVLEYNSSNTTNPVNSYDTGFSEELSCLDYGSSGTTFLAGSRDGNTNVFSVSSGEIIYEDSSYFNVGYSIIDCGISPSMDYMAWLVSGVGENFLNIKTYPDGNSVQAMEISGDAVSLSWTHNGDYLHIATNDYGGTLESYSSQNWMLVDKTYFGHRVRDFDYNQMLDEIATTTGSKFVPLYSNGWNSPNIESDLGTDDDLDGDLISNNLDLDIDGDGIENSWDVNCDGDNPSSCSLIPDKNTIRKISITVDNSVVRIKETIQFNTQYSSILRELASGSESIDGRISQVENSRVSNSFCQNINSDNVKDNWAGKISIQDRYFVNSGEYFCEGLIDLIDYTHDSQYEGRVVLSWSITYNLNGSVERPYNITISNPPAFADGVVEELIPTYPLWISITDVQTGKGWEIQPVYKETEPLTLFMAAPEVQELPSWVEVTNYIKENSILLAVSFAAIILSIIVLIRSRNRISLDITDEEKQEVENRKAIATGTDDVSKGPPSALGRNRLGDRRKSTPPGYSEFDTSQRSTPPGYDNPEEVVKITEPELYTDYDYEEYGEQPRSRRMRRGEKRDSDWDYKKDSRYWSKDKYSDYDGVHRRTVSDGEGNVKVRKVKAVIVEEKPKKKRKAPKRKEKVKPKKKTKESRHKKELPKPIKSTNIPIDLPEKGQEESEDQDIEEEMFNSALSKIIGNSNDEN